MRTKTCRRTRLFPWILVIVLTFLVPSPFCARSVVAGDTAAPREDGNVGRPSNLRTRRPAIKPLRSRVLPGQDPLRIEVKFADGMDVDLDPNGVPTAASGHALGSPVAREALRRLREAGARWRRASSLDRAMLTRIRKQAELALGREIADLSGYFKLTLAEGSDSPEWMNLLNSLPEVELASPLPLPAPGPSVPDYEPLQGYLGEAPEGLGASFVWTIPGGTGVGVGICDLEYSWNLAHEDLPPATVLIPEGDQPNYQPDEGDHGTAVLGEMFARRNGWGMTGASYEARCYVAPVDLASGYAFFEQILYAVSRLEPGDVILIELQTWGPYFGSEHGTQFGMVPMEWVPSHYNAILAAIGNGIHVVTCAGNGNQDLDDPIYQGGVYGHAPFLPVNDSGAIVVGGGVPPISPWRGPDRSRLAFSNYGSRVDLQGWGVDVATTGIGDLYSAEGPNRTFSKTFGGTSSAAPNVASAVASIEGIVEQRTGKPVPPLLMRKLLIETGSPQVDGLYPASQSIGPRPDLRSAYLRLDSPIVVSPEIVLAYEGDSILFLVEAADFDGDPVLSLAASPIPLTAAFTASEANTRGDFVWHTSIGDAGIYDVIITASNSEESATTTRLIVEPAERGPVVSGPAGAQGVEGGPTIRVLIYATEPNGDPIVSFTASTLPAGASFTTDSTLSVGTFTWRPDYTQSGEYVVGFTAESASGGIPGGERLSGNCQVVLSIRENDRAPVVVTPGYLSTAENYLIEFEVSASDPDGDSIQILRVDFPPPGSEFSPAPGNATGSFRWTPRFDQAGRYRVDFIAQNTRSGGATVTFDIQNTDLAPSVTAPESVAGTEGVELTFNATASDPDAEPIFSFGSNNLPPGAALTVAPDRSSAHFAWTPALGLAGPHVVTLFATSRARAVPLTPYLGDTVTVRLTVERGTYPARVYLMPDDRTIRLATGRPRTCARIEPVDSLFRIADIDPGSITLSSPGTESIETIPGSMEAGAPSGDRDGNGIDELPICFSKEDLRLLFAGLRAGLESHDVVIEGRLSTGGKFRGASTFDVVPQNRAGDARVTPNPARGGAALSFWVPSPGRVSVRLYDVQGRLAHLVYDNFVPGPRYLDVPLMSSVGVGAARLSSGIYFYQVTLPGEDVRGRFAVLK